MNAFGDANILLAITVVWCFAALHSMWFAWGRQHTFFGNGIFARFRAIGRIWRGTRHERGNELMRGRARTPNQFKGLLHHFLCRAESVLGEAKPNLAYIWKMFGFEGKSGFAKKNLGFGPEQKNQGREPERRKKRGFIIFRAVPLSRHCPSDRFRLMNPRFLRLSGSLP